MKKHLLIILVVFSLFHVNSFSQEFAIMTYNIRLDVASDGENAWVNRKDNLVDLLKFYNPDIFGIQEGLPQQVTYIDEELTNFGFIGEGREGKDKGEFSAIFYNKNTFEVLLSNTFWLSETPNSVSKGWDAAYPRVCTYGLFKNKETGLQFWVLNTHLDHIGDVAREEGVKLILEKITILNTENFPVILTGDFNLEPNSEPISILKKQMNDSRELSIETPFGPEGTFNSFVYNSVATNRIDYIFVSKSEKIVVEKYAVFNNSNDLRYPSDHFPVYVELLLKN